MIIDNSSTSALNLLPVAPARTQKTHGHKKTEATEAAESTPDETAATQTAVATQNTASILSPVADASSARSLIQSLKQNFLQNPGSAMLAQANQVPQNALRLLQ